MWKKGWCRNPLLYSPQQSHLVGEDDLDCNRGMGSYWDPIEGEGPDTDPLLRFNPPPPRTIAPAQTHGGAGAHRRPAPEPIVVRQPGAEPVTRQRTRKVAAPVPPPSALPDGYSTPQEPYTWGEYLRRSYPVIGVILLLGAFWVWSAKQLSGNVTPTPTVPALTPTAQVANNPPAVITPTPGTGAGPSAAPAASALPVPPPGVIAAGARVVIVTSGAGANIRDAPTTAGAIVTSQDDGTPLTITGASKDADGFTWWPVQGDGFTGWIAGALIELAP